MKKIRSFALVVFAALATSLCISSCEEEFRPVVEGLPASLTVCISSPSPVQVATKATDLQETQVRTLSLFFFDKRNLSAPKVVVDLDASDLGTAEEVSSTNYIYKVTFEDEELTSGEYFLYAIANSGSSNFGSVDMESLRTASLDEFKSTVIKKNNDLTDMIEASLLLTGVYGTSDGSVTLEPGDNDLSAGERIHLRRVTSKITFNISVADGVTFTPDSYSIYNYSKSCTLFERSGWVNVSNSTDNVSGTFPPASGFAISEGTKTLTNLEGIDLSGTTLSGSSTKSFTFYMVENAAETNSAINTYKERDIHKSATDQGFANAPEDGTYIVFTGHYKGPAYTAYDGTGTQETGKYIEGDVTYTIHLGNFSTTTKTSASQKGSFGNFAIRRNAKYNYDVKIAGVNGIVVEAQYDGTDYASKDSGASGYLFTVSSNTTSLTVDSHFETVMVKLPKTASYQDYTIRSITPYEKDGAYTYTSFLGGEYPSDVNWIHFAAPTSKTELATFPGISKTATIAQLLADLASGNATYYINDSSDSDYYYTTAFIDEYFYYADDSKTAPATPLSKWVNAAPRELTLAASIDESKDGLSSFAVTPIFTLKQKAILSMYDIDNVSVPFGIETIDEFPDAVWLSSNGAHTEYGSTTTSDENGWANFTGNFSLGTDNWSSYIDASTLGHFDNNTQVAQSSMTENYGYSQCLSRNRDENGNGVIDASEVKWYLPAVNQCQTIWFGYPVLGGEAQLNTDLQAYWTSSAGEKRAWYFDEGTSYGYIEGASDWLQAKLGVRCARTLSTYNATPVDVTTFDTATKVVDVTGLVAGATRRSGSVTDEYILHQRGDNADQLPEAFQIAKANLVASDEGAEYTILAPQVSASVSGTTATLTLTNYSALNSDGYSLKINATASSLAETKTVDLSGLTYSNNAASASVVAVRTISGTSYDSNPSTVSVTRTEATPAVVLQAPKGSVSRTSSGNGANKKYTFVITLTNYSSDYTYSYATSRTSTATRTNVTVSSNKITISSISYQTIYLYATSNGTLSNYSTISNSFSAGDDTTISAATYSYSLGSVTNGSDKTEVIGGSSQSTFNYAELTTGEWCKRYYYENDDKSDKGLWRIPNEREFGLMIRYIHGEFETAEVYPATRTYYYRKYDSSPKKTVYFYDYSAKTVTTKLQYTEGSSTGGATIRCVRDVTPVNGSRVPASGVNSGDYNYGGNAF